MKRFLIVLTAIAVTLPTAQAGIAQAVKSRSATFGSISAGQARMRVGPGREYPASWLYQREGLPVKVIETYRGWKKIEDPDGAQGWMQGNLVSQRRTGLIRGEDVVALRENANAGARILWRAQPGVVGRISRCARGWCWFDVRGRAGFVEVSRLWGVSPDETLS